MKLQPVRNELFPNKTLLQKQNINFGNWDEMANDKEMHQKYEKRLLQAFLSMPEGIDPKVGWQWQNPSYLYMDYNHNERIKKSNSLFKNIEKSMYNLVGLGVPKEVIKQEINKCFDAMG